MHTIHISQLKPATVAAIALAASMAAHADSMEWRILGPAASYHFTKDGAQLKTEVSGYNCRTGTWIPTGQTAADGEKLGIPSRVCSENWTEMSKLKQLGTLDWDCNNQVPWTGATISVGGQPRTSSVYVCKFTQTNHVPRWSSNNPALGLEASWRYDTHVDKVFGTFVRDSYGQPGFMAGVARMWTVGSIGSFSLDAGATGGLWYRTALNTDTNELHRVLLPYVLPAFSVNESSTGLGINAAVVPRLSFKGRYFSSTWAVIAQVTYLVSKKETGTKQLSLEADASGELRAVVAVGF